MEAVIPNGTVTMPSLTPLGKLIQTFPESLFSPPFAADWISLSCNSAALRFRHRYKLRAATVMGIFNQQPNPPGSAELSSATPQ